MQNLIYFNRIKFIFFLKSGAAEKGNSSKEPSKKDEKAKQRASFIKRLSDPFNRRGSKEKEKESKKEESTLKLVLY